MNPFTNHDAVTLSVEIDVVNEQPVIEIGSPFFFGSLTTTGFVINFGSKINKSQ